MSTDATLDTTDRIFSDLNEIERALCSAHFGKNLKHDTPFTALRERFSRLSALVSIQQVLQGTAREIRRGKYGAGNTAWEIRKHDEAVFGQDLRPKITKFLDAAFGEGDPRLEKIVPEILRLQELPQRWIFAEGTQLALASRAEVENMSAFQKEFPEEYRNQFQPGSSGGTEKQLDKDSAGKASQTVKLRINNSNDQDFCAATVDFEGHNAIVAIYDQWLTTKRRDLMVVVAAALQLAAPTAASFYIYIGNNIGIGKENRFWFSRGRPSCDAVVLPNSSYPLAKSISGAAQGVACEGHLYESRWTCEGTNCHQTDPQDIDKVEMNTGFGHYSIYITPDKNDIQVHATASCLSITKKLYNLRERFKDAPMAVVLICSESDVIAASLTQTQSLLLQREDFTNVWQSRTELPAVLDCVLTGCLAVFSSLEIEIQRIMVGVSNPNNMPWLSKLLQINTLAEIKQILIQKQDVVRASISTTKSLRSANPSIRVSKSIYDGNADYSPLISDSDPGDDTISAIAPSDLNFDFDDLVINSHVYRKAAANAQPRTPTIPQPELGDLIDWTDGTAIRKTPDAAEALPLTLLDLLSLVVHEPPIQRVTCHAPGRVRVFGENEPHFRGKRTAFFCACHNYTLEYWTYKSNGQKVARRKPRGLSSITAYCFRYYRVAISYEPTLAPLLQSRDKLRAHVSAALSVLARDF
ncbi:hypothetical protein B0T26DRAFT_675911 [Lasiosphaeria miniovina]|uniref:Uncharacterized protein n=1 Tax=Lasiosphaeria miniovina TaxID=1954250 RepID=A0AA40DVY6_9PEZI|nr:uncharacterized protein B0T26DRAFT_675911 [Lasiosphaeria miniovina]KAK0717635.1 hypothetical protein B0T26DRAFT_675911 [Lasiosphaeria miniovina]